MYGRIASALASLRAKRRFKAIPGRTQSARMTHRFALYAAAWGSIFSATVPLKLKASANEQSIMSPPTQNGAPGEIR